MKREKRNYWKISFIILLIVIISSVIFNVGKLLHQQSSLFAPFQKGTDRGTWENLYGDTLDMANTVSPIMIASCDILCPFPSKSEDDWGSLSGDMIYKREPVESCISGIGNVYYCRCYRWDWQDDSMKIKGLNDERNGLFFKVIEDKPLEEVFGEEVYSCISENDLFIPYYDKELAEMGVGETKLIRTLD